MELFKNLAIIASVGTITLLLKQIGEDNLKLKKIKMDLAKMQVQRDIYRDAYVEAANMLSEEEVMELTNVIKKREDFYNIIASF